MPVRLPQERIQSLADEVDPILNRDDDRHQWAWVRHGLPPLPFVGRSNP